VIIEAKIYGSLWRPPGETLYGPERAVTLLLGQIDLPS
jgi:hypothetical protein